MVRDERRSTKGAPRGGGNVSAAKRRDGGKRLFYILLAVLLIAGITALSMMAARPKNNVSLIDTTIAPVPNQGHVIGSDTAPVEVIEFADFECPACGSFGTLTEPDVRNRLVNTGVIRYRFIDLPLNIHRNTWSAHRAGWCAGEQGKFWEMHDILFFNQDRWNGETTTRPDAVIEDLAKPLGLNMSQFSSCVASRKYDPQIRANRDEAQRQQIPSTPSFIFGNKMVKGAISYDVFKAHVDSALAQARASKAPAPAAPTKSGAAKAR